MSDSRNKNVWITLSCAVGIVFAGLLAYWNSIDGVFIFDDLNSIVHNPRIRNLFPIWTHLTSGSRGLTYLSFAVNYHLSGLELRPFHWTNLAIHLMAGVFLYLFLLQALNSNAIPVTIRECSNVIAFAIALVWIVHPLNTQAVTYIVQRGESLMGLFFFLMLLLYAKANQSKRPLAWLIPAFFVFCLGLASKEVMAMALPVLLLYSRAFVTDSWKGTFFNNGWFWILCSIPLFIAVIYLIPSILGGSGGVGFGLKSTSPLEYLRTQPQIILYYMRLAVWPSPLVFDYGWPVENDFTQISLTGGLMFAVVLALVISFLFWPSSRIWSFWGLAFVLVLLPTSSILPLQDLAVEHRMYVPLAMLIVPLVSVVVLGMDKLASNQSTMLFIAVFGLLVITLGYLTHERNKDYHSSTVMWHDVIDKTVGRGHDNIFAGRTYNNLGQNYGDLGDWKASIEWLHKALQEDTFPKEVHGNLARAYLATNRLEQAKSHVITALSLDPDSPKLLQQAGLVSAAENDHAQAEFHFRAAVEKNPRDVLVQMNLAQSLVAQKKLKDAESLYRDIIKLDPKFVEAKRRLMRLLLNKNAIDDAKSVLEEYKNELSNDHWIHFYHGEILLREKKLDQAIQAWEKSLEADPPPRGVYFQLGNGYRIKGDYKKAMTFYENAIRNNPNHVEALNNLGGLLASQNPRQAIVYFERVVKLAPKFLQARFNIASLNAQLNRRDEAKSQLQKILQIDPGFDPAIQLLNSLAEPANQ